MICRHDRATERNPLLDPTSTCGNRNRGRRVAGSRHGPVASLVMPVPLPENARALLDRPEFATVATVEPDGRPHLSVVWVGLDGDDVLFSTVRGRRKTRNLERDPRVTVLVYPKDDPYTYVEIRGTATLEDDPTRSLIDAMSRKYEGKPWDHAPDERVIVRVSADKVVWYD